MYVKTFRYGVRPEKLDEFLAIQEKVIRFYARQLSEKAVYLQDARDPFTWLEIHWFPDEATCRASASRLQEDPALKRIWQQFSEVLDPLSPAVVEEFQQHSLGEPAE